MDFIFECFGEIILAPFFELAVMAGSELLGGSGSFEAPCEIQTLFGNDAWWNT